MTEWTPAEKARIVKIRERASKEDIALSASDIGRDYDGELTIDGMLAEDWLEAMISKKPCPRTPGYARQAAPSGHT